MGFSFRDTIDNRQDGLGRLISRCMAGIGERSITCDRRNVLTAGGHEMLHGAGVDDPLLPFPAGPGAVCGFPAAYFGAHEGRLFCFHGAEAPDDCTGMVREWQFSRAVARSNGLELSRQGEDETGLSYFRKRWYDAKTGRSPQEDPIGQEGVPSRKLPQRCERGLLH